MSAPNHDDDSSGVVRLRHRLGELQRRHDKATERVALFPNSVSKQHLEAMRFELAELEWRLAELESPS